MAETRGIALHGLIACPLAVLTLLAACATTADHPDDAERLAAALAGHVAGKPTTCVSARDLGATRIIGETILYDGPGHVIYRNDPPGGCPGLSPQRALVTVTPSTQICAGDLAGIVDLTSRTHYGSCAMASSCPM